MSGPSFAQQIDESIAVLHAMHALAAPAEQIIETVSRALLRNQTLYTCGNGGSATDAFHLAQELVGRYRSNRRPLPAVCLNADVTALTCIANDFGYDQVFSRQLAALGQPGDVVLCFSTSGNSPNILRTLEVARQKQVISVAWLGKDGGPAHDLADHALVVPSHSTARIQEIHTLLLHALCERVETLSTLPTLPTLPTPPTLSTDHNAV